MFWITDIAIDFLQKKNISWYISVFKFQGKIKQQSLLGYMKQIVLTLINACTVDFNNICFWDLSKYLCSVGKKTGQKIVYYQSIGNWPSSNYSEWDYFDY